MFFQFVVQVLLVVVGFEGFVGDDFDFECVFCVLFWQVDDLVGEVGICFWVGNFFIQFGGYGGVGKSGNVGGDQQCFYVFEVFFMW